MRNSAYNWRFDKKSYFFGFLSAIAAFLALAFLLVATLTARGITVQLDSEEMAIMIREQVVAQAQLELPNMIVGAKSEIPRIVEEEMQNQISDRMEIAGYVFKMPEELMMQLEENLRRNVENATGLILDGIDTDELANQFGRDVYSLVKETMQNELHNQTFPVFLFEKIPVMVRVQVT